MTDVTLTLPSGGLLWGSESPLQVSYLPKAEPSADGIWEAWLAHPLGDRIIKMDAVNLGKIKRQKGTWAVTDFGVPKTDLLVLAACKRWETEIQITRNGVLQFVGPIVAYKGNGSEGRRLFGAWGVLGYMSKRIRATSETVYWEMLSNPAFTAGLANWTSGSGIPAIIDTTFFEIGTQSALLSDDTRQLRQIVQKDNYGTRFRYTIRVACRVWIEAAVTHGALPLIEVYIPGVSATPSYSSATFTETTPRETWTWVECLISVDGETQPFNTFACIYNGQPDGSIWVDRASCQVVGIQAIVADLFNVNLPEPTNTVDVAAAFSDVVNTCSRGLNIGVSAQTVGIHVNDTKGIPTLGWDRIKGWIGSGFLEVDERISQFSRTLVAAHRLGRLIPESEAVIQVGDDGNAQDYYYEEDATRARSEVYMPGADGIYGQAHSLDAWGGTLLQDVIAAPAGVDNTIFSLNAAALYELKTDSGQALALSVTGVKGELIDVVKNYDTVMVIAKDNDVDVEGYLRVLDTTLDPVNDTFDIVFNIDSFDWGS